MNVRELIEQLQKIENQEALVVMSKDAEGNNFSPLCEYTQNDNEQYLADNTWAGGVVTIYLTPEQIHCGWGQEDVYDGDDSVPVVVLWPIN